MSSLNAYNGKVLQSVISVLEDGYTVDDIRNHLNNIEIPKSISRMIPKEVIDCKHVVKREHLVEGLTILSCKCGYSEII